MAKFTFPIPGRKKQTPAVTVTAPPLNKAEKVLGSTALSIDASRNWDNLSNSGISVSVTESTATTSRTATRPRAPHDGRGIARPEREWGDESDVLPHHLRFNNGIEDDVDLRSDLSTVLRKQQSSSTLMSWYDKSKQPLSISQQTSASAMAKGLPPKAHQMLDMDNFQPLPPQKKKLSRLDLSHLMSRSRGSKKDGRGQKNWDGPLLDTDHVVRSPSVMSLVTPPPIRQRNDHSDRPSRLQKKSTKESLRLQQAESTRPDTSESNRQGTSHLHSLPNLYEHYEQMSFRQALGPDIREEEERVMGRRVDSHLAAVRASPAANPASLALPGRSLEQDIQDYSHRQLPKTPQPAPATKVEQSPSTDCAASISSRFTRTSRTSKRTEQSLQEFDLLEKSVLSLSSDSEDDSYVGSSIRSPSSIPTRRHSDATDVTDHTSSDFRPTTSRTAGSGDTKRFSRSSKGSKRTSFAPTNTYLTIPNGFNGKPLPVSTRSSSTSTRTIQQITTGTGTSSRVSNMPSTSVATDNTAAIWPSRASSDVQEAHAMTMMSSQGPSEIMTQSEQEQETETETETEPEVDYTHSSKSRDSLNTSGDQPTPPLSPSSVDFYIRSAHSSVDGPGSHNRFMAVTRQEELLLAALRHKRQVMRETILSEFGGEIRGETGQSQSHQSNPSEASILEESFDLDFPAPPSCKDKTKTNSQGTTVIDLRSPTSQQELPTLKPTVYRADSDEAPTHARRSSPRRSILKKSHQKKQSGSDRHERILLYIDRPIDTDSTVKDLEPDAGLSDFVGELSEVERVPEGLAHVHQHRPHGAAHRQQKAVHTPPRARQESFAPTASQTVNEVTKVSEAGVPRPDSPISPDGLGALLPKPSTVNKKTARLSAVGLARW